MTATRLFFYSLIATFILTLMVGSAMADCVYIDDIPGLRPTVKVFDMAGVDKTAEWVTIIGPDPLNPEFLHFQLAGNPWLSMTGTSYTDFFIGSFASPAADRLIVTVTLEGKIDVQYGILSGKVLPSVPMGAKKNTDVLERSDFETQALMLTMTGIDDGNYHFYVRTQPPPPVPEPASLLLIGTGFLAGVGLLKKRKLSTPRPNEEKSK